MAYPAISAHRMPFDIDGTKVAWRYAGVLANACRVLGMQGWLSEAEQQNLNREDKAYRKDTGSGQTMGYWFFFPELREVTHLAFIFGPATDYGGILFQGSPDSTNGMDGSWETGVYTFPGFVTESDYWRSTIMPISFSGPIKCLFVALQCGGWIGAHMDIRAVHVYGQKAAAETPDDLVFCSASTGAELTALIDWGDQPEGTTEIGSFKVKNTSEDKIANNINLQLNHPDFTMAWSADGPWTTVLDIATLGVGALSNTIYVRNQLAPPLLLLGPKAARVIASVGSWT